MIAFNRHVKVFWGNYRQIEPAWQALFEQLNLIHFKDWRTIRFKHLVSESKETTHCFHIKEPQDFYFKRYTYTFKQSFEFWMRPSKAAVEVFAYHKMDFINIPHPEVIGFSESRFLGLLKGCYIATKTIPNSQILSEFALNKWYFMPSVQKQQIYQQISNQLIDYLKKAHQIGFYHYDLKWRNILLETIGKDQYRVIWIDPPRAKQKYYRFNWWYRVRDLSALARMAIELLTTYQKMRFLYQYLGENREKGETKQLFLDIDQHLSKRFPVSLKLPPYPNN